MIFRSAFTQHASSWLLVSLSRGAGPADDRPAAPQCFAPALRQSYAHARGARRMVGNLAVEPVANPRGPSVNGDYGSGKSLCREGASYTRVASPAQRTRRGLPPFAAPAHSFIISAERLLAATLAKFRACMDPL
jgi:hypothetical protein